MDGLVVSWRKAFFRPQPSKFPQPPQPPQKGFFSEEVVGAHLFAGIIWELNPPPHKGKAGRLIKVLKTKEGATHTFDMHDADPAEVVRCLEGARWKAEDLGTVAALLAYYRGGVEGLRRKAADIRDAGVNKRAAVLATKAKHRRG